jgi:hypothetical protein
MMYIDGIRRQVSIKFTDYSNVQDILKSTNGTTVYKHTSGEISTVRFEIAGMWTRRILPPEITGKTIRSTLSQFEELISKEDENLYKNYRYAVANAVKIVTINLTKHIPSHVTIVGYRAVTSYDCQP